MLLRFVCFCFFLACNLAGFSASGTSHPLTIREDSVSTVQLRKFDEKELHQYASQKEFKYGEADSDVGLTYWERFWHWVGHLLDDLFKDNNSKVPQTTRIATFFRYLLIASGVGVVLFVILKMGGLNFRLIFTGRSKNIDVPFSESIENIHEISFDTEIEKAITQKNYRLAVRLLYLNCLKGLNDAGRIDWQADKTNAQYLNELKHEEQKRQFGLLTRQFEFVWYGGFDLSSTAFSRVKDSFYAFNSKAK